jgi:hypothetical protein
MLPRYNIRQMLWLTLELAALFSIPIVVLGIGRARPLTAFLFVICVVCPIMLGPMFLTQFRRIRQRRRALQDERRRFMVDILTANKERSAPSKSPLDQPQRGGD